MMLFPQCFFPQKACTNYSCIPLLPCFGGYMSSEILFFSGFILFITLVLALDLGLFHKHAHTVGFREAIGWSALWIALGVAFYFFLLWFGHLIHNPGTVEELQLIVAKYKHPVRIDPDNFESALAAYRSNLGLEYLTGYLIEKALSVDNIFVIYLIFITFNVSTRYYHKVLFWGIIGAIVMRFVFIFLSSALIQEFEWILYIFGLLLVYTGIHMFLTRNKPANIDKEHHPMVRFASRFLPVDPDDQSGRFFTRYKGKRAMTTLFIALLVIEFSDVVFAIDSVPAIFSVTKDPYIVFFSNIFAILGLRSLFFVISQVIHMFHYLKHGLSLLLVFIGAKMLVHDQLHEAGFTTTHSLLVVAGILTISMIASIIRNYRKKMRERE